jgi:hypothetical protein
MLFASTSLAARIERTECRLPAGPSAPLPEGLAISPVSAEELGTWLDVVLHASRPGPRSVRRS